MDMGNGGRNGSNRVSQVKLRGNFLSYGRQSKSISIGREG